MPIAIALAGFVWPPVTRGSGAFAGMVWLGIAALLCLIPSIAGVIEQIQALGSQTLLPSFEAAYPWLLALGATSLFSGLGIARRLRGAAALRRRRFVDGALIAIALTALSVVAVRRRGHRERAGRARHGRADVVALRTDRSGGRAAAVRRAARGRADRPPAPTSSTGTVDLRPIGSVDLIGVRDGSDFRWAAYVATDRRLGQAGAARIDDTAWAREPGGGWITVDPSRVARRDASTSRCCPPR